MKRLEALPNEALEALPNEASRHLNDPLFTVYAPLRQSLLNMQYIMERADHDKNGCLLDMQHVFRGSFVHVSKLSCSELRLKPLLHGVDADHSQEISNRIVIVHLCNMCGIKEPDSISVLFVKTIGCPPIGKQAEIAHVSSVSERNQIEKF